MSRDTLDAEAHRFAMTLDARQPVLVYSDAGGERSFALERESTSIGRSPGQDIVLQDAHVSRQHAVIVGEGEAWTLIDQKSSYGTYVNGTRVQRAQLFDGDLLQFGSLESIRVRFRLPAAAGGTLNKGYEGVASLRTSLQGFPTQDDTQRPEVSEIGQLNWLLSAARQLNAGNAVQDILTTLLELTLQLTGVERGFVFLQEGGEMKLALGLTSDGEIIEEDSTVSRRAMQRAIESEKKFSISDTLSDNAASLWASVMINRIRSIYCIPLRRRDAATAHGRLLGLLYLDSQVGPGYLSEVDHQLLDTIATEAAALLHNALLAEAEFRARQVREELAVAARIQSGLMAVALPVLPFATLQARSEPCLEIGGDFFAAVTVDDCLCAAIADVSGKGVSAAIVAATMQGIIHAQLLSRQSLAEIAAQLNQFLCTRQVGKYATLVLLKLAPDGTMEYVNCGHVQPVLLRDGELARLEEANPIVGLLPQATYTSAHIALQPGDRLLLATDGLVEAENGAGEAFGDDGFDEIAHFGDVGAILDHVAAFHAPEEAQDDCTLLQIVYTGGESMTQDEMADESERMTQGSRSDLSSRRHRGFRHSVSRENEK